AAAAPKGAKGARREQKCSLRAPFGVCKIYSRIGRHRIDLLVPPKPQSAPWPVLGRGALSYLSSSAVRVAAGRAMLWGEADRPPPPPPSPTGCHAVANSTITPPWPAQRPPPRRLVTWRRGLGDGAPPVPVWVAGRHAQPNVRRQWSQPPPEATLARAGRPLIGVFAACGPVGEPLARGR